MSRKGLLTMVDKTKKSGKQKRGRISEEDIFCVLQRYTATTVLALLHEVGQFEGAKIDWNAIVKKTSTGITSAREYQMLWRHLAYRDSLLDKLNDNDQLLDDDSDLEYELEACPEVSGEVSAEAAASVKVLMACALPNDTNKHTGETVEASLIRSTTENLQLSAVQKQQLAIVTDSEGKDGDGTQNQSKKKRKTWSDAKDLELIAAVRKFGEGNWTSIVKSGIMGDSTTSQLSQRWANIRKKNNLNFGTNPRNSQLSEAQQAARHAVNMALDPPTRNTFINRTGIPPKQEPQKRQAITRFSIMGTMGTASKGANLASDPVRAAAVFAGARIVSQSDAASLLKSSQGNNVVHHIMPKGSPSIRTPMLSGASSTHQETRPKVHHPSTGVAAAAATSAPLSPPSMVQGPRPTLSQPKKISPVQHSCSEPLENKRDAKTVDGCRVEQVVNDKTAKGVKSSEGNNGKMLVAENSKETVENSKGGPLNTKPEGTLEENDIGDCKEEDEKRVTKQQSDDGDGSEMVVTVNKGQEADNN